MARFTKPFTAIRGIQPNAEKHLVNALQDMLKENEIRRIQGSSPVKVERLSHEKTMNILRQLLKEYKRR